MKGFSLVELMIALAIVGVVSSIAYPSYQGYIQDTYHGHLSASTVMDSLIRGAKRDARSGPLPVVHRRQGNIRWR